MLGADQLEFLTNGKQHHDAEFWYLASQLTAHIPHSGAICAFHTEVNLSPKTEQDFFPFFNATNLIWHILFKELQ